MEKYLTKPASGLRGAIEVASDKSISHRGLIFSSLAKGTSKIRNLLLGEDVLCTLSILNQLGVKTSHTAQTIKPGDELVVHGVGLKGLKKSDAVLYCGNSGTAMRLMIGVLAGQPFESTLTGDAYLNKRPMDRVLEPLRQMGAVFKVTHENGSRLIRVNPDCQPRLNGICYDSPMASAQVKTAILLAGLFANGKMTVTEPHLSRNHTELMLKGMGCDLKVEGCSVSLSPGSELQPIDFTVPGDMSSAAFLIVAALITRDSDLLIRRVGLNPTRSGLIDVLKKMGARIDLSNRAILCGEEIGDIRVRSSQLKNISISGDMIPRLIDEIPVLALAGSVARGEMVVSQAGELRVKETDRIQAICCELTKMGASIEEKKDGFVIQGQTLLTGSENHSTVKHSSFFRSYGDHRMAMMETVAGLVMQDSLEIDDVSCVRTSFPGFFDLIKDTSMA